MSDVSLSPAAERMRLHRHRRRNGLRCVTIQLRATEIAELVRRGWLPPESRNDEYEIARALHKHLDHSLSPSATGQRYGG